MWHHLRALLPIKDRWYRTVTWVYYLYHLLWLSHMSLHLFITGLLASHKALVTASPRRYGVRLTVYVSCVFYVWQCILTIARDSNKLRKHIFSPPFNFLTFICWLHNLKSFWCILTKFVMHVTNDQFSDKFNNGWKKFTMFDLLRLFVFYVNTSTLWAQ